MFATSSRWAVRRMQPLVVAVVAALTVAACGTGTTGPKAADTSGSQTPTTITLGLYSGVADPTWVLTASQSQELFSLLAQLPTADATAPTGGLGYHGFTIEGPDGTLVAYDGIVSRDPGTTGGHLLDPERVIERFLLSTGQPHLKPGEHAEVRRSLAG